MFCEQRNSFSHLVSYCILLTIIILLGDKLASMLSQSGELWRALVDNATHGAVGALSWAVVELPGLQINKWLLCVLCGLLSSCIDLDHFWQAKSLYLHDALRLKHRPPLHSTTLIVITTFTMWILAVTFQVQHLKKITLICFTAWISHHIRDANRHGIWFPPFGSSPPLPYILYIAGIVVLSLCMHAFYHHFVSKDRYGGLISESIVAA